MTSNLLYIAGSELLTRSRVRDVLVGEHRSEVLVIPPKLTSIKPTVNDISNYLCNYTLLISSIVMKRRSQMFVCYDYLLPVLIASYFSTSRGGGIEYVYRILERLKYSPVFVVPSYIHYVPFVLDNPDFGINCFSQRWDDKSLGRCGFREKFQEVSWMCFVAMQDVFENCTYFDIHQGNNVSVSFPIELILYKNKI